MSENRHKSTATIVTNTYGASYVGRIVAFFLLFTLYFVLYTAHAFGATYALSPASGSYEVGQTFQVRVMAEAGTEGVNTGDATISFDSTKLTAVSVSKDGSPFNLWVTEPAIQGSTITYAGGGTTAVSGSKAVITITFRAKTEGSAKVEFTKGTLLAGAGKNVLTGSTGATFTITPATPKQPVATPQPTTPPKQERVVNIPVPDVPVVKSTSHPVEDEWYSLSDIVLSWDIPYGVTSLKTALSKESNGEPTEMHEPPIASWKKSGLEDGIWYFHIAYKNRGGWSSTTSYKLQVDTTPPEEFEVIGTGGDLTAQVRFEAVDTLSGIAGYQIVVGAGRPRDVAPADLVGNSYTIPSVDPGDQKITVTARDKAGNERTSEVQVKVFGALETPEEEGVKVSGFGAIYWVSLLFMALLAIVITMLVQERRRHTEEKDRIKREAAEAGDKLINVFGVLRDEMEEKVLMLSHKPNMTDNERNILEGLKDALDISEELIDKEIEDVRKLLK